eukprot:Awhi_evm1s2330
MPSYCLCLTFHILASLLLNVDVTRGAPFPSALREPSVEGDSFSLETLAFENETKYSELLKYSLSKESSMRGYTALSRFKN